MKQRWKREAEDRIDAVLERYRRRGVPELEAVRAALREFRLRGLDLAGRPGQYSLRYLERLEERARRQRARKRRASHGA